MSLESEFSNLLNERLDDSKEKLRDIGIILHYYGFQGEIQPTYEETGIKYGIGTRERVRQIINEKFTDIVKAEDLPLTQQCAEVINEENIISSEKISEKLIQIGFFNSEVNLLGLFKFLHQLKLTTDYRIYTPTLESTNQKAYLSDKNSFVIKEKSLPTIKKAMRKAKTLPGQRGIAKVSDLKDKLDDDFEYFNALIEIIKSDGDSWFLTHNEDSYYLLESRDNTLINSMEKVKFITETVELDKLVSTLLRSLDRVKTTERPTAEILKKYLQTSKHTTQVGENIQLNLESGELTDIENDVVKLLEKTPNLDSPSIAEKLIEKNYERPYINKNVFCSPLVYRSGTPGKYTFSLIGDNPDFTESTDRYSEFLNKLKSISKEGTDYEQTVKTRKEQKVLSDWLFDGKLTEFCAICGKEYSVISLVVAHKKKRSECSENERTDPNIVMPLCLFGCDYVYEQRYLRIQEGKVIQGSLPESLTDEDKFYVEYMIGNSINENWLEGNKSYFE